MIGRIGSETGTDVPEIFENYRVIEPDKVAGFLGKNAFLKELIIEAVPNVTAIFQNPHLFLQVVTDREDPADTRLVISIDPTEVPKEAFEKLNLLRQNWWFDASDFSEDKLEIVFRYR